MESDTSISPAHTPPAPRVSRTTSPPPAAGLSTRASCCRTSSDRSRAARARSGHAVRDPPSRTPAASGGAGSAASCMRHCAALSSASSRSLATSCSAPHPPTAQTIFRLQFAAAYLIIFGLFAAPYLLVICFHFETSCGRDNGCSRPQQKSRSPNRALVYHDHVTGIVCSRLQRNLSISMFRPRQSTVDKIWVAFGTAGALENIFTIISHQAFHCLWLMDTLS